MMDWKAGQPGGAARCRKRQFKTKLIKVILENWTGYYDVLD
jgi:hypothetical protein